MAALLTPETAAQCSAILAALKAGRSLTPEDALRDFKCFRLAARIYDLRMSGHDIVTTWERSRQGHKRWARYVLLAAGKH